MAKTKTQEAAPAATAPKKTYTPSISAMQPNSKFGEGALLGMPITAEGYDSLIKNVTIGSTLVAKPAKRKDGTFIIAKNNKPLFFLEILPPRNNNDI